MASSNSMGVSDIANFIPELWGQVALGYLQNNLNLAKTVDRNWDDKPAKYGDTIHIPKRGSLSANAKSADSTVTKQFPQSSVIDVSLDQHYEVSFIIEDIARAQANQDVMGGYVTDGIMVLAEQVETGLAALYSNADNSVSAGASLVESELLEARKYLIDGKLPKLAPRYGYFCPEVINDLLQIARFTEVNKYGPNASIMDGELGKLAGIRIFESQLVQTSGSPSTYHNLVYGPQAMILAFRSLPMAPEGVGVDQSVVVDAQSGLGLRVSYSWDKDYLGLQVTIDALWGLKAQRTEHMIDVQTT